MFPHFAAMCEVLSAKALVQFWENALLSSKNTAFNANFTFLNMAFSLCWNNTTVSKVLWSERERKIDYQLWFACDKDVNISQGADPKESNKHPCHQENLQVNWVQVWAPV